MFYEGLKRGLEGISCGKVCTNVQMKGFVPGEG
jgi:hypothetical protein